MMFRTLSKVLLVFTLASALPALESAAAAAPRHRHHHAHSDAPGDVHSPARDGLYVVATHSGMTVAPALGELVAGEILDERQSDALERFRPARFERAMT